MKRLFIILLLLASVNVGFGQTSYERQLKYWYLRDRLRHFIIKSDNPLNDYGSYLVITSRNRNYPNNMWYFPLADYGQEMRLFSKYIGVLATEYYLLMENDQFEDAEATDQELYSVLTAFTRLDLCENRLSPPLNAANDGFWLRHDVPDDSEDGTNTFILNSKINENSGILIQEDPLLVNQSIRTVDHVEGMTSQDAYFSMDEAVFLLEGLALAYKFGSNEVRSLALNKASKVLNRLYGWYNGIQTCTWVIHDPYGNIVPESEGGDCRTLSFGLAKVATDFFGLSGFIPVAGAEAIWLGLHNGTTGYNARMVATIAAISKGWGPDNWPFYHTTTGIFNNTDQDGWDYYFLWLYKALWNKNYSYYSVDRIEDRLDEAPCTGPYFLNFGDHGGNGWSSPDRWSFYQNEQYPVNTGDNTDVGIYVGLDYMILLNLYYINYEGSLSEYKNYITYIQNNEWPYGGETGTIGSISDPFFVERFRSIETNDNLYSYTNNAANVIYQAGINVKLIPGFKCEKGANLLAEILPMNYCTSKMPKGNTPPDYPKIETPFLSDFTFTEQVDMKNSDNIKAFPNPSSGIFQINNVSDYQKYNITRINGDFISSGLINKNHLTLNLTNEDSGIYILSLYSQRSVIRVKLSLL